jgi:hypothetical protein
VCRRYWKHNLKTVRRPGTKRGGEYLDGVHFRYQGGQVRSSLSLISYLGSGEYRTRYLGVRSRRPTSRTTIWRLRAGSRTAWPIGYFPPPLRMGDAVIEQDRVDGGGRQGWRPSGTGSPPGPGSPAAPLKRSTGSRQKIACWPGRWDRPVRRGPAVGASAPRVNAAWVCLGLPPLPCSPLRRAPGRVGGRSA